MEISSHLRYENNDQLDFTVPSFFVFFSNQSQCFHAYYLLRIMSCVHVDRNLCLSFHSAYGIWKQTQEYQQMVEAGKTG